MNREGNMAELHFPLTWSKCPNCGCTDTLARAVKNEQVTKGKMKEDVILAIRQVVTPAVDMREVGHMLSIPVLVTFYDICLGCGHEYCVRVDKVDSLITAQPGSLPGQGGTLFGKPMTGR